MIDNKNGSLKCSHVFKYTSQVLDGEGGGHQKITLDYRGEGGEA